MTRIVRTVVYLALISAMAGCAWPRAKPQEEPVPDWVRSLPQSKTAIYAVASWPPTFFPQDAEDKARANARAELAKTLQVKISGILVDWQSNSPSLFSAQGHGEDFIAIMSKETLEISMSGSQIIHTWIDKKGRASGVPGTVYALAKLDRSSLSKQLLETANDAKKELTKEQQINIEEKAKKAFEDLDKRLEKIE